MLMGDIRQGIGGIAEGLTAFQDNSSYPHVEYTVLDMLLSMCRKILDSHPRIPDLSLCDFHVFVPLKKALEGHGSKLDRDIKAMVLQWFQLQPGCSL
jgi:hypothetical protein